MRLFLFGLLLFTTACRRPSQQFHAMLTPTDTANGANNSASLRQQSLLQDIWVLTDFRGSPIKAELFPGDKPRLEISVTEGRVTGTTGCNRFNGSLKADTRSVSFGSLSTTRMACMGDVGTFEQQFLAEMSTPFTYQIADRRLTLLRADKPVMVFKKVD